MRGGPEPDVEGSILHFHDDPVDLVTKLVTARLQVPAVREHRPEVGHDGRLRVDGQAGAAKQVQRA